jgi:integrase
MVGTQRGTAPGIQSGVSPARASSATRIQKQCGLQDVRIHDLRHTFASLLVSGGASLEMVGKLLGHSQMQTTLRYAHLMDSPLRAGVDAVASAFRPKPRLVHDADDQGGRKSA